MSLQTTRFGEQTITNSYNIFVDSEKGNLVGDKQSRGDDVFIHFEGQTIEANDNEMIRISLLNFTMFNNTYMVNINNSRFNVKAVGGSETNTSIVNIDRKNYKNLFDLATSFATNLGTSLIARSVANGSTVASFENTTVKPVSTSMSATDDRLLDITLTAKNSGGTSVNHNLTNVYIQMPESEGECYNLLGGNRQDDITNTTFSSLKITVSAQTIRIQGYYPCQRMTDPYVYLRCGNAQTGLEMSVLSNDRGTYNSDIINSDILAKMIRDVEFINYDSATGSEYFMNLQQRKVSSLRLFLTDSKGRFLGRTTGQRDLGTSSGLLNGAVFESNYQSTLSNLFFTACLRVDIIRTKMPVKLNTGDMPIPPLPARQSQSVLTWADYGKPNITPQF